MLFEKNSIAFSLIHICKWTHSISVSEYKKYAFLVMLVLCPGKVGLIASLTVST